MKPVGLWLLFLLCAGALGAQAPRIRQLSMREGLPSDIANCLLQDREGFLWLGTANGLVRYDGYAFNVFRYAPDDPHSLGANIVEALYEDRSGTIWVGHVNGLSRFDKQTERFISYTYRPDDSTGINAGAVIGIHEDAKGRLWVTTWNGGLQEMDRTRGTFRCYFPQPEARYHEEIVLTSTILPDRFRADCFWVALAVAGQWQLYSFNGTDKTFTPCASDSLPRRHYIWSIFDEEDGTVWLATSAGLRRFDPQSRTFLGFDGYPEDFQKMRKKPLLTATRDALGQLWVGTYTEGLYAFDRNKNLVAHYRPQANGSASLSSHAIKSVLRDRAGVVWVGAAKHGLNQIITEAQPFRNFRPDTTTSTPFVANSLTALIETRSGEIWVGTENTGLLLFDPDRKQFQPAAQRYPALQALVSPYIYSLYESRDGQIWIGLNGFGLQRFDPQSGTLQGFRHDPADSTSLSADYVSALFEDHKGQFLVGTFLGFDRYDARTGKFVRYRLFDSANTSYNQQVNVTCFYEDQQRHLWIGSNYGLSLMDSKTGGFRHFLRIPAARGGFKSLNVSAIHQDQSGVIWAGTENGLYRLRFPDPSNPHQGSPDIRRYAETEGLPNRYILSVHADSQNRLWLNTLRGLSVFRNPQHDDRTPPDFKNYRPDDGLQSLAFTRSGSLKSRSGLLYLGGQNGFDVFAPDSIRDDPYRPQVVITAFEKFDADRPDIGAVREKGASAREEIVLSYKNNIFTIEFAALDYRAPENCRYAYRMLGFSKNWVQLGPQRQVTFTNLDPGTYTFEVRGTNSDGIWSDQPAVLKIVITPPWWKTVWAYLAYALLFAAGVAGFVRLRLRFLENRTRQLEQAVRQSTAQILEQKDLLEKQAGELQELDRLKSRFFANITHELRTPLTLMLGPLNTVLKNWRADSTQRKMLQIAQENGRKLLHLVSEILDLGKLDADRMTVENKPVPVQELLARLVAQFDSHAGYLGVQLTCKSDLPPGTVVLLDAKKFETVVNNLLSNALKFTPPGGSVSVGLARQDELLLISVQDTGRGIHPEDLPHVFDRYFQTKRTDMPVEGGTGIGLALSAELVRLCSGRIWAESRVGEGSVFWVEWPGLTPNLPTEERDAFAFKAAAGGPTSNLEGADSLLSVFVGHSGAGSQDVFEQGDVRVGAESTVRILVAEDNPDLQQYLLHLLAPEYEVVLVGNGEEALAWLDPTPILPHGSREDGGEVGLIISDIMMPRMDGFQLLERLKNDDRYRHIPVVMLTARADIQDKLRALRTGVDDYLTKPFDEEELLTRVRNLIQRQQLRATTTYDDDPNSPPPAAGQALKTQHSKLAPPRISQADAEWLAALEAWTLANLKDDLLTVTAMAQQMTLSDRQLLRRLKALTGLAPQQYIAEMRLQKARESLEIGAFRTVAEAAYAAGFGNAKAFSRAYRERFGRLPSSYF